MDKKLQSILDKLAKQGSSAVSIAALSDKSDVSPRTIRRRLHQLIELGLVTSHGKNRGVRYALAAVQAAPDSPPTAIAEPAESYASFGFSAANQALINQIQQPLIRRQYCSYRPEWLAAYQPNRSFYLSAAQRDTLRQAGQPLAQGLPAGTYARQIFNHLLINLSYNSSRLEGNTYSLADTEKLLLSGKAADGKLDMETLMLINHKEAIRFLVDGINRMEISVDNIRSLHYLLADGLVQPEDAGQVRTGGVRISSSVYLPWEGEARLMAQLSAIVDTADAIHDPYEQSFFLLVHLAYLQAFIDVNKRTARLAANLPLVRHNCVPVSFSDISVEAYVSSMLVCYELNETGPLAELYTWSYLRSCEHYTARADSLGIDLLRVQYRAPRRALIADIVRENLHGEAQLAAIDAFVQSQIEDAHRKKFLSDLRFDLDALAPHRIAGMGITQAELAHWQACGK